MAGADLAAVQRIMRHTDPRITMEFYAHLAPGYLRSAIDRLAINPGEPEVEAAPVAATATAASPAVPAHVFPDGCSSAARRVTWPTTLHRTAKRFSHEKARDPDVHVGVPGALSGDAVPSPPRDALRNRGGNAALSIAHRRSQEGTFRRAASLHRARDT